MQSVAIVACLSDRPNMAFIAWVREDSRARSIAGAIGGEARVFYDLKIHRKWLVPLRYALSALRTLAYLIERRPRALIVQAPPVPAAVIAWLWARVNRVPLVIDSHPASFGTEGVRADQLMRPLLAWLAPRATACIVTTPELGGQIERWGGRYLVVHEAPMPWSDAMRPRGCSGRGKVLFVCTFAPDEPVSEVLEAARRLPGVVFQITGDTRRLSPEVRDAAPENIEWVGYLGTDDYVAALAGSDIVVTLTERAESVNRSAYEAVDALRPLVLTDLPHMRELFPHGVFVENEPESIAAGVAEALRRCEELSAVAPEARAIQHQRWQHQLVGLQEALGLGRMALNVDVRRVASADRG
jgi:glycosyltransferase involved in cell wall biosynthesis